MSNAVKKKLNLEANANTSGRLVSFPQKSKSKELGLSKQKENLILEFRERGRKLARSILKGWRMIYDLGEIDSIVDLSLCEAADRFDAKRSVSFMTFFYYHLKGNLIKMVSDSVNNSKPFSSIDNEAECSFDLQLKIKMLTAQDVAEAITGKECLQPEDNLLSKELERIRISACAKLGKLEQIVIERILFNEEGVNEVASELGYSRCHISRVKGKALDALKKEFEFYLAK